MPRYVALLRGINVGGHRVKMDRLRELFRELGFSDVETHIASGNVIFTTSDRNVERLERRIESHLAAELGYAVPTFIRSPADLEAIATFELPESAGPGVHVIFCTAPPSDNVRHTLVELGGDADRFVFSGRQIYWLPKGKVSESPVFRSGLDKAMGSTAHTARNLNTVLKLVAKSAQAS